MQPVIELQEEGDVRFRLGAEDRMRTRSTRIPRSPRSANPHIILDTGIEIDDRTERVIRAVAHFRYATAFEAVLRIERPVLVDASVDTQAQIPSVYQFLRICGRGNRQFRSVQLY